MAIVARHERPNSLPCVFHVADLTIRLGWAPQAALRQLFFWKKQGQVKGLGGQSWIFANLFADQYPDWELGLRMIMPTAVVVGIEVLRRAGLTTQIPYVATVAVSSAQPIHQVERFEVAAQSPQWFELMSPGIRREEVALAHLAPAWALADLISREGWCHCGLGPDDICWDYVSELDRADWNVACLALSLGIRPMNPDNEGP
jgi:hypothetical protein